LRVYWSNRKYPFTGGAEARLGRQTERRTVLMDGSEAKRGNNLRQLMRVAPREKWRFRLILSHGFYVARTLFDN
jgi:hypothetical protein|uniref:hypothetical protein n=1 Tax=Thiosulfatihalobacter marinus TaxID=2792481 RepID=UPI001E39BE36